MMEKLKTVLLLFLVGLSLFLTYQLWYGQKPAELIADNVYEQVDVEPPRPLEDAIVPDRIVVRNSSNSNNNNDNNNGNNNDNYNNENHDESIFLFRKDDPGFEQLWEELSGLLKTIETNFVSGEQNAPPEEAVKCLSSYFKPQLPVGNEMPWLSGLSEDRIENLVLSCFEDTYWLSIAHSTADKHLVLEEDRAALILSLIEDIANEDISNNETAVHISLTREIVNEIIDLDIDISAPVFVPRDEITMKELNLEAENLGKELLLKTFFVDHNLARVIEERDGSLLYTDGEKGLRLTDTGFEYSHPRMEEGHTTLSYSEALRKSSSLISYHGGWQENLRLEKVALESRGGLIFFESKWLIYYDGYPLFTGQPTKISFNDLGLFHFTRFLFKPALEPDEHVDGLPTNGGNGSVTVTLWSEALLKATDEVIDDHSPEAGARVRLESMELGYAVTGTEASPEGIPVWIIIINGEKVIMKAHNLEIISEEDLL